MHFPRHTVGIEPWGERCPRVAPCEGLVLNGHRPDEPAADLDLSVRADSFRETRAATIRLTGDPERAGVDGGWCAPHNGLGR